MAPPTHTGTSPRAPPAWLWAEKQWCWRGAAGEARELPSLRPADAKPLSLGDLRRAWRGVGNGEHSLRSGMGLPRIQRRHRSPTAPRSGLGEPVSSLAKTGPGLCPQSPNRHKPMSLTAGTATECVFLGAHRPWEHRPDPCPHTVWQGEQTTGVSRDKKATQPQSPCTEHPLLAGGSHAPWTLPATPLGGCQHSHFQKVATEAPQGRACV